MAHALELRRLLAQGSGSLPRFSLIDAVSIDRHLNDFVPTELDRSWQVIASVLVRSSQRQFQVVISGDAPQGLQARLGRAGLRPRETGPLESFVEFAASPVTIVVAGLEEEPWRLAMLRGTSAVMHDLVTGRAFDEASAISEFGPLNALVRNTAITRPGSDKPLVREAARHREAIERNSGLIAELFGIVPDRVVDRILNVYSEIHAAAERRFSPTPVDAPSAMWISRATRSAGHTGTSYLLVVPKGRDNNARRVVLSAGGWVTEVNGDNLGGLRRELATTERWVMPRALDAMQWLADQGLPLPSRVVDPGLTSFAIDPDEGQSNFADRVRSAFDEAAGWVLDVARECEAPSTSDPVAMLENLRQLDAEPHSDVSSLGQLVEEDLAPTLPLLARMEQFGVSVGPPIGASSWEERAAQTTSAASSEAAELAKLLGVDVIRSEFEELTPALVRHAGPLSQAHVELRQPDEDLFRRYVTAGNKIATRVANVRTLVGSVVPWMNRLARASLIRGVVVPGVTGRWTYRIVPLHNLPTKSPLGREVLGALSAPSGDVLVSADYSAIEPRLLALLSLDPVLLRACHAPDLYDTIADTMADTSGVRFSREAVKRALLALLYGQSARSFSWALHDVPPARGRALFRDLRLTLRTALEYRAEVGRLACDHGHVQVQNGWRRLFRTRGVVTRRRGFNTKVQGTVAALLRLTLRLLHYQLPPEARLMFQQHDSVLVACPPEKAREVAITLKTVMTVEAPEALGLFDPRVPLVVRVKEGRSWADVL